MRYSCLILLLIVLSCTIGQEVKFNGLEISKQIQTVGSRFQSKALLVSTLDGQIHAVDPQSGEIKWSVDTGGGTLVSSSQNTNSTNNNEENDEQVDSIDENPYVMIPSVTGNLYIWNKGDDELQKFPGTVRDLVAQSPFYSKDGTLYMASKNTRVLAVDSLNGHILCEYTTEKAPDLIPSSCAFDKEDVVLLVRVDYAVHAIDKNGEMKWNITYSDVQPSKTSREESIQSPLAFTTSDGMLYLLDRPDDVPRVLKFAAQPVNIYQQSESSFQKVPLPTVLSSLESEKGVFVHRQNDDLYALELRKLKKNDIHKLLPSPDTLPPRITVPDNKHPSNSYLPTNALIPYERQLTPGFHKVKPYAGSKELSQSSGLAVNNNHDEDEVSIDDIEEKISITDKKSDTRTMILYSFIVILACIVSIIIVTKRILIPNSPPIDTQPILPERVEEEIMEKSTEMSPIPENSTIIEEIREGYDQVGKFLVSRTEILGHGSNGTVVYMGELDGRTVAVKRMLKEFYQVANKEISLLIQSDQHPNVVRYFAKEQDDRFVYLALEYCPYTLDQYFEQNLESLGLTKQRILQQLVLAVEHIHSLGIVHRDLKPGNVLISKDKKVKLSDMGLGKRLEQNRSSFHTEHSAGTLGWQAPESLFAREEAQENNASGKKSSSGSGSTSGVLQRLTRSVDIFSLGCIMYYIMTDGEHPFGDRYQREANIMKGKFKLDNPVIPLEVRKLFENMLDLKPEKRISAQDVLKHPVFWSEEKKLSFLGDVSDQLGKEKSTSAVYHHLQARRRHIFSRRIGGSLPSIIRDELIRWDANLDKIVLDNCLQYRKYDFAHVWDLLRCIRNIRSHYREYDPKVHALMQPLPGGIYNYFDRIFPNMFYEVYDAVCKNWRERPVFKQYFENFDVQSYHNE